MTVVYYEQVAACIQASVVENGQAFTVTRDGHRIGELIPLRRRRFVPRQEFAATSRGAAAIDIEAFRGDQDAASDQGTATPYDR